MEHQSAQHIMRIQTRFVYPSYSWVLKPSKVFWLHPQDCYEVSRLYICPSQGIPSTPFTTWGNRVILSLK